MVCRIFTRPKYANTPMTSSLIVQKYIFLGYRDGRLPGVKRVRNNLNRCTEQET